MASRTNPRADSPDRPPTTGRNYLQPQQTTRRYNRITPATGGASRAGPFPRFCYQLLSCSAKSLSSRIVSMRSSGALRNVGADAQICPATLPLYLRVISSTTRDYVARLQLVTVGLTKRSGKLACGYASLKRCSAGPTQSKSRLVVCQDDHASLPWCY